MDPTEPREAPLPKYLQPLQLTPVTITKAMMAAIKTQLPQASASAPTPSLVLGQLQGQQWSRPPHISGKITIKNKKDGSVSWGQAALDPEGQVLELRAENPLTFHEKVALTLHTVGNPLPLFLAHDMSMEQPSHRGCD